MKLKFTSGFQGRISNDTELTGIIRGWQEDELICRAKANVEGSGLA